MAAISTAPTGSLISSTVTAGTRREAKPPMKSLTPYTAAASSAKITAIVVELRPSSQPRGQLVPAAGGLAVIR